MADTGVGIAPEDQEAVFEEFRQVGSADKKVEGNNPKNLKSVRDTLQVKGYQTIEAETGEEGRGSPAAATSRSGDAAHTPVIAVTASVMPQDRTRIMAAGFDGFQEKPISVRKLLATVREILDKRSGQP
jgi:two-component system cell cycle response regulator DivK